MLRAPHHCGCSIRSKIFISKQGHVTAQQYGVILSQILTGIYPTVCRQRLGRCRTIAGHLHIFALSHPHPALLHATVVPCRPSGASLSPSSQVRQKRVRQKKGQRNTHNRQRKYISSPPPPLPPSGRSTISSSSSHSPGSARVTTLPTLVPCRKVRTAGVARSSWKSSLKVGARGCFHSQAFPTLFHSSRI